MFNYQNSFEKLMVKQFNQRHIFAKMVIRKLDELGWTTVFSFTRELEDDLMHKYSTYASEDDTIWEFLKDHKKYNLRIPDGIDLDSVRMEFDDSDNAYLSQL